MTPTPTHPTLTVSCEEFYILAWSLFTLGRCGETLYCSAGILRPQGFGSLLMFTHFIIVVESFLIPIFRNSLLIFWGP